MSILVTGGAGFIGSHLIERLMASAVGQSPIVCLDNFNDYYDPRLKRQNVAAWERTAAVQVIEGDVCDQTLVESVVAEHEVDTIIHLAAYAGVRYSVSQPEKYQRANVAGTLSVLEAARKSRQHRIVVVSSSTVYGRGAQAPFVEDAPLGIPMSPYGATKRSAELLALTYHQLHDLPVVIVRPFSVYGPRLRPDLALSIFTRAIDRGEPLPLFGDGSIRRDFTHVTDIVTALVASLSASGVVGQALNLGHHDPIEIRRLISLLEENLGKSARIDRRPPKSSDMPVTWADLTKVRELLGYAPQVDIEDGVKEFVAWYRAEGRAFYEAS